MATPTITTVLAAQQNSWSLYGSGTNWYAEKCVQGGKVMAVNATSAGLLGAVQQVEQQHGSLKTSPMFDKGEWAGHI